MRVLTVFATFLQPFNTSPFFTSRIKQIEDSKKRKYESKENSDNETANDKRKSEAPEEIKNADVNQSPKNKFEEKDDEIEEPKLHG